MMLELADQDKNDILLGIYNSITFEEGICYKSLSRDEFDSIFFAPGRVVVAAYDERGVCLGFAAGSICPDRKTSYITYIGVDAGHRHAGVGASLLAALEASLTDKPEIEKIDVVFHNPAGLPWRIPGGGGADHPCAPGVDNRSAAYGFLGAHGYFDWCLQNSYYLDLSEYSEPPDIASKRAALADSGIIITLYDEKKHTGFSELFDDINNPGWRNGVLSNTDKPIIVAVDEKADNLVAGYTGPLTVQPSGRGNFCGIGTRHAYRGRGIGKVVFCEMCRRHSENGAKFMSLYTGDTNPARNIYESAGFSIVRSWANVRKLFK